MKIVRAPKFASNSAKEFVIVLTLVVNSHADQTLYVYQAIIDQRAFVVTISRVIQMISIWVANQLIFKAKTHTSAKVIPIARQDKFVLLAQMDSEIVLTHALRLLAV